MAELIWTQDFPPDSELAASPGGNIIIKAFNLVTCSEIAEDGELKLDLSFQYEFAACSSGVNREPV